MNLNLNLIWITILILTLVLFVFKRQYFPAMQGNSQYPTIIFPFGDVLVPIPNNDEYNPNTSWS